MTKFWRELKRRFYNIGYSRVTYTRTVYVERPMTPEERKLFDAAFAKVDEAFALMDEAFKKHRQ